MKLDNLSSPQINSVIIAEHMNEEWLAHFCRLNHVKDHHKGIMERMLSNIITKKGFISLYDNDQVIACGLGIIEREYLGLYDIVTDLNYRNQGFGEEMILHLLQWGQEHGARYSYLAVVADNKPAQRLYAKLGYSEVYTYWYRVKA